MCVAVDAWKVVSVWNTHCAGGLVWLFPSSVMVDADSSMYDEQYTPGSSVTPLRMGVGK